MTYVLRAFSYGHGGLGVALFVAIAWCTMARGAGRMAGSAAPMPIASAIFPWLVGIVGAWALTAVVLTSWYLFCPGYLDHIEASVASSVHTFIAGAPLYPAPGSAESYTFGGLMYGPLLAEVDSLGFVLFRDSFATKIVGYLTGWISVALLVTQLRHYARGIGSVVALAYGLSFLLSFGADIVVSRPEPLLLLFAAASLAVALRLEGFVGALLLGLLCAAAMGLKAHAPLYLLPAVYLWIARLTSIPGRRPYVALAAGFSVAAVAALILPFAPPNVSVTGYLHVLGLAAKHGLNLDLFGRNCAFVAGLWAPLLLLRAGIARQVATDRRWLGFALTLFAAECLVAVIASKPGAGIHHFLPFLAPHALLFQALYVQTAGHAPAVPGQAVLALAAVVLGMGTPSLQSYGPLLAFDLQRPEQTRQRDELLGFAQHFPRGMLGVADNETYDLANFRPWLTARGIPQADYGAFMDLKLSGSTDAALASAFERCVIPFVYVPKPGAAFTLLSNYTAQPLFSDGLRNEFAARYSRRATGDYFDVFGCDSGASAAAAR